MPYLQVRGLNKFYQVRTERIHVLRELELDVDHGEMVAVIGASGVGTSVLPAWWQVAQARVNRASPVGGAGC